MEKLHTLRGHASDLRAIPTGDEAAFSNPLMGEILQAIGTKCEIYDREWDSLTIDPPNLLTVSNDRRSGLYVGLHIDYWDALPLEKRQLSRSRLCVNIGNTKRYFLLVNLTIAQMLELLESKGDQAELIEPAHIGQRFLVENPGYPVIRLRIEPGEAYLAPTENMLHDGSSHLIMVATEHVAVQGHIY
ncbi:hypothetical protein AAII07_53635 [Microvirga sp. 0TCS3.31]